MKYDPSTTIFDDIRPETNEGVDKTYLMRPENDKGVNNVVLYVVPPGSAHNQQLSKIMAFLCTTYQQ